MKFLLAAAFTLIGTAAFAQEADREARIERIQTIVGSLVARRGHAEVMLKDLTEFEGAVVALAEDAFSLRIKVSFGKKATTQIFYDDVLSIRSQQGSASFIPPPDAAAYGSWDEVVKFKYNTFLKVVLADGRTYTGRLHEKTKEKMTLVGETVDQKFTAPRAQVVSLYRVRPGFGRTASGLAAGVRKGRNIGDAIGLTPEGKSFSAAIGTLIGAGIGAAIGSARRENEFRVLVYSK
jgi:hypothetical protein